VIYHVYLPSFRDSDGDELRDPEGVVAGLPYLDGTEAIRSAQVRSRCCRTMA
jgi:hypothetical protein